MAPPDGRFEGRFPRPRGKPVRHGKTPPWPNEQRQSLDDQARLVEAAIPPDADQIYLVGHSFGGSVAMKAAARLHGRVSKLVLFEPNPLYLLAQAGRAEAFAEAMATRNTIKEFGGRGEWETAAQIFADRFGGAGTWQQMPPERRQTFVAALRPNYYEWDAVLNETTPLEEWARLLPRQTLVVSDPNSLLTVRDMMALLRQSCPMWTYKEVTGGHMAPLTRPDLVNPIVVSFLRA